MYVLFVSPSAYLVALNWRWLKRSNKSGSNNKWLLNYALRRQAPFAPFHHLPRFLWGLALIFCILSSSLSLSLSFPLTRVTLKRTCARIAGGVVWAGVESLTSPPFFLLFFFGELNKELEISVTSDMFTESGYYVMGHLSYMYG